MIDRCVEQLTDEELGKRPAPGINSVAIILQHLGGNLRSRWTDFLTTDGEKPDRNRDGEFAEWDGDRAALIAQLDRGWLALTSAIESLDEEKLATTIFVRGEPHSLPLALMRSITHLSYHVGQITIISRTVHTGPWQWLTVPPGQSQQHNQANWGKPASRGALGK
jgi:uncharacterized damage-inducible protein DinB